MRIGTSSFVPDFYQHSMERLCSLIPPRGILEEYLTYKARRLYNISPEFVKEIVDDMEGLGVIVYHSKLMTLVPEKIRRNMREAYFLLKR